MHIVGVINKETSEIRCLEHEPDGMGWNDVNVPKGPATEEGWEELYGHEVTGPTVFCDVCSTCVFCHEFHDRQEECND